MRRLVTFTYVFRVNAEDRVEQVKVRTARRHTNRVEVIEGITAHADIVASGAAFLNDGDIVKPSAPVGASLAAAR